MKRSKVIKAFEEYKINAKLDYALNKAPDDCKTCSSAWINKEYGKESKGIWLVYYTFGMNKRKWDDGEQYICHDLTKEQAKIVVQTLSKYFKVEWDGDESRCIQISNKGVA